MASVVPTAGADGNCDSHTKEVQRRSTSASAGTWTNYRNQPGSLRFESELLLKDAVTELPNQMGAENLCEPDCGSSGVDISFSSIPNKFLSAYSEKEKCERYERETRAKPFTYTDRRFASAEELNSWFSDFSQGKGKDGSDLYAKCDGVCSPQYSLIIRPVNGQLLVDASVVCGKARDKDDNSYTLKTAYRWRCRK